MMNQLGKFYLNIVKITQPLGELLNKNCSRHWETSQENFSQLKYHQTSDINILWSNSRSEWYYLMLPWVHFYENSNKLKPVALILPQELCTYVRNRVLLCANWKRYHGSSIGLCDKFIDNLLEQTFLIETDHKLLVSLLGTKASRILRFWLCLSGCNYVFYSSCAW